MSPPCWASPNGRSFSTEVLHQKEEEKPSNRATFKAINPHPSILAYIKKIGVGVRPKSKHKRRKSNASARGKSHGDTLDETEESEYFSKTEKQHRLQWQRARTDRGAIRGTTLVKKGGATDAEVPEHSGAYWLPPPPFSSAVKGAHGPADAAPADCRIVRRPVKTLGKAGSLADVLPRESRGLAEVAIAGRSNVGKSTLLNALLYGNTDVGLAPRTHRRGRTPAGAKLPKGTKAPTSSKPGETKELTFYQLTADVAPRTATPAGGTVRNVVDPDPIASEKMSLLLVDLPGYGFAFAKEARTTEWKDLMHHYLLERRGLKRILLLLDARHGFKNTDFAFLGDLQEGLQAQTEDAPRARRELPPIQIVLTKCDLVKQSDLARRVSLVREQLSDFLLREPSSLPIMLVSARAGVGFNNLRRDTPLGGVLELQRELASLVPMPRAHKRNT